jgi:hypothetical protein
MPKSFRDRIVLSGITVLTVGVTLLIFTFISAYGFLTQALSIIASADLVQTFGAALAPLIATSIHIMYLGVMGWVGSLLTIRGVTIITAPPTPESPAAIPQQEATAPQQKPLSEKPEEEQPEVAKFPEPEVIVIPPDQVSQPQPQPKPEEP